MANDQSNDDHGRRADQFEFEGIRIALEGLKSIASLAIALIAGLFALGATRTEKFETDVFLWSIGSLGLSGIVSTFSLFMAVIPLRNGIDPIGRWYVFGGLLVSLILLCSGIGIGVLAAIQ